MSYHHYRGKLDGGELPDAGVPLSTVDCLISVGGGGGGASGTGGGVDRVADRVSVPLTGCATGRTPGGSPAMECNGDPGCSSTGSSVGIAAGATAATGGVTTIRRLLVCNDSNGDGSNGNRVGGSDFFDSVEDNNGALIAINGKWYKVATSADDKTYPVSP